MAPIKLTNPAFVRYYLPRQRRSGAGLFVDMVYIYMSRPITKRHIESEKFVSKFWSFVNVRSSDDCWGWKGFIDKDGYGRFAGYHSAASRIAMMIFVGKVLATEDYVLHTCDLPSCCNLSHLYIGTQLDNMRDMIGKGRSPSRAGEDNGSAKLDSSDVMFIRKLYASGKYSYYYLGDLFEVNHRTIGAVVRGETWKNLE